MNIEHMEGSEASNQLLKNKYNLHDSPEAKTAALRTEQRTGERVAQNPLDRIQNYLNRFHEIVDQKDPKRGEHGLDLIKGRFHAKYVMKPDEIPEAYFDNQRRLAREQGHGDIEIDPQTRAQLTEVIIADQTSSLDKWMNYLSSPDAPYSDALKYFTLRSIVNMAEYDKERKMYPQRSKGTTKPFPDLNREALAYVLDAVEKKYQGQKSSEPEFNKLLQGENFARLYAWAIEKVTPATEEELSATKGSWVKYNKNSDPMPLVQSLQGHGTGWCTAGESTAQIQLEGGDFYVYYSMDKDGKLTTPRAAIRMEDNRIGEVRGIAPEQNLDSGATHIVEEKLKEFGQEGERYKKRVHDMEFLTAIENKVQKALMLGRDELLFLYEVNAPIDGFGYGKDPRIRKLQFGREPYEDLPIMFECTPDQIAHKAKDIKPNTKAYVGPLEPGIFDKLPANLEHVYTSFPEGRIKRQAVEIGGKSKDQLKAELKQAGVNISQYADDMINSPDFVTLKDPQTLDTVRLRVSDLGLKGSPTTDQVYAQAEELGLELCPPEVGPQLRLKDTDQPMGDYYWIGMKQIA
ncbi:MAG: hypothetical protein Q7R49_03275, partial [Candidatus Daviesbacteria bacterium]|nr:hypothetical protein [Candidatus Daviesbacteria bacterium]